MKQKPLSCPLDASLSDWTSSVVFLAVQVLQPTLVAN